MKHRAETWESIIALIFWIGTSEVVLFGFMVTMPSAMIILLPLAVGLLIFCIARCRKIFANERADKKLEELYRDKAKSQGSGVATSNFYSQNKTGNGSSEQSSFFDALKLVAKNNANKETHRKYASYANIQQLCEELNAYALKRGIKLGDRAAESLVMAMVSSKCIFVKKTGENIEDILSVVGEFFSGEKSECLQLEAVPTRPAGLIYYYDNDATTGKGSYKKAYATDFFKKVYASAFTANTMCACALKDFSEIKFEEIFSEFIEHFKKPYGENACYMSAISATEIPKIKDKKFVLPHNLWFFFLLNGDECLPQDASLWSETIEINGIGNKTTGTIMSSPMAYSQFNEIIEGAFDENFLPLDIWKKLDKVEDYLYGVNGFKIDNILARQIERLTTMQVACGSTHAQAMDIAIAHKVLPCLSGCKKEDVDQEGTTLKELLDGLFGVENLPETHKVLGVLQWE